MYQKDSSSGSPSLSLSPFVQLQAGRWYLILDWDLENPLPPDRDLRLRPLSPEEGQCIERYIAQRDREAFALYAEAIQKRTSCP